MPNQCISSIVFRADGDSQIGLGHIMRCLALAEMFGKSYQLQFAIQQPSQQILQLLQHASFQVISLPKTTDYLNDAINFVHQLKGNEFVVLDGYLFREAYQKLVKQHCWKLLAVDDLAAWHQYADLVINHGGNVHITDYEAEPYTTFFLGTQYALLRSPFLKAGQKRSFNNLTSFYPNRILINLGGADPENISHHIVEILSKQAFIKQIVVVLGAANPHGDSFHQYKLQGVQVRRSLTPKQMVTAIQQCDLAIVSCSTISYEVATVGKPFIGILTATNQIALRDFYITNNIALSILENNFATDDLLTPLSETPAIVSTNLLRQQFFFDGRSGERIALLLQTLLSTN